MREYSLVPAEEGHIRPIAENMREADRLEVLYAEGASPRVALKGSLERSRWAWTGIDEEGPVCMFGVGGRTPLSLTGIPWFLSTDRIDLWTVSMFREARKILRDWLREYDLLENHVHSGNTKSVAWLKRMKFTIDHAPVVHNGVVFHRFWREA